ncbi:NAD(P)-binding protein [Sporormia fimetaria CBS 119925]|uniref:NAD(P)-binding protein n=1 Tax=Sporormia fimetaria CBS 119925 TaxID=1340428 RepID=A0A6A6VG96_9PLEO|nr:NAD(P)-binding protein [Sporormia fimetaria CBS 119925]
MPPTRPEWNQETGGLEVAKAFNERVKGKTVLITGVSPESIGSSTAIAIASQGPKLLILASRTQTKLEEVRDTIKNAFPDVSVRTVLLDLMSQEAIRKAATEIAQLTDKLDILINNAGAMTSTLQHAVGFIEAQFATNHIGHFLLTILLLPQLREAARSNPPGATRVVNLTSLGHRLSPIRFSDYNFSGNPIPDEEKPPADMPEMFKGKEGEVYNGYVAYAQSKTANILFSVELTRRLEKDGIVSYAVHPGSIWTALSRDLDADGEAAMRKTSPFWKNHDQGAATTMVAALDPNLDKPEGVLLHNCQYWNPAPHATDPETAMRLWALSGKLAGWSIRLHTAVADK